MRSANLIFFTAIFTLSVWRATAQIYDTNNIFVEPFASDGFSNQLQIVSDSLNNLFVLDGGNKLIKKITPDGNVSVFVGGGTGGLEGYGTNVSLAYTSFGAMTIDSSNTLWIIATLFNTTYLLSISNDGFVSIENASLPVGQTTLGIKGICVDSFDNIYYYGGQYSPTNLTLFTNVIYRYSPGSYTVAPFAFVPIKSSTTLSDAFAIDSANNIYFWGGNGFIYKIDPSGNVRTITGSIYSFDQDGGSTNSSFANVAAMAIDNSGNLFLSCSNCVRKITQALNSVTIAGSFSQSGNSDGVGSNALFSAASGVCVSQSSIYIADSGNQRVRKILINPVPISGTTTALNTYPGLTIAGIVNRAYQIQSSPDLISWSIVTNLLLPSNPYLWFDPNPVSGNKFYRAVLLP